MMANPFFRRLYPKALAGLLLVLLGAALYWAARGLMPPSSRLVVPPTATAAAQDLLSLSLQDASGRPQALAQWRGRPLLINYWATWCGPCREEMPLLATLSREQSAVQVLGIAWDSAANVAEYARQHPETGYPLLLADSKATSLLPELGNPARGLPFSLLLGANGEVLSLRLGAFRAGELGDLLERHSVANGSKMK
ncbi:TlpA disulfide reductase family protein [Uliginosibacterium sp. 31-16]|uniref:TlpA family protein disulfide reductase n=1 Tax=Uliginosibacterium sp. 31-16 TaxID=3068315 RepID=UPI00273DAF4C|nr:TlpA disulfide reductase family protein [Uliginosibacterium sp. 31-16]MDP5239139.1 TlpA disulfide reductase family protein [Uliginosibacterium sp. 31-16]